MRSNLLLLGMFVSFLLCSSLVVAVAAASMCSQTHGSAGSDFPRSLVEASDAGYALVGNTWSFGVDGDFWLAKTDDLGVSPEYSSWPVPGLVLTATEFIMIKEGSHSVNAH